MNSIHPQAAQKLQSLLMSGERIYWAGMPNPQIIFHSDDWTAIPFSVLWTAFCVFWEGNALGILGRNSRTGGADVFMALWGIPFLVIGNYFMWGRFLMDAWLKTRTYYAVTNRRVLILQEGRKRKTSTTFLDAIPTIEREGTGTGTLWFGPKYPIIAADIDDVDSVHRLIVDLREKAASGPISGQVLTGGS